MKETVDSAKRERVGSIWTENAVPAEFDPLDGKRRTDVLIIGGGIAGILCAYALKEAGVDCLVVEANRICHGVTKNTTAKLTLQHGLLYDKLIRCQGLRTARLYLESQMQAMEEYEQLCRRIPCDYEKKTSYVYSVHNREKVEREIAAYRRLGFEAVFSEAGELPFRVAGAVGVRNQAQFHPLKFLFGIARELPICEHTKVLGLMPGKVVTEHGEVLCKKMIVATHFPILNKHGGYFLKMYQDRSYVLALEGTPEIRGMYVDERQKGISFRNYKNLLLLGGGSHRTGKKGGNWQELEQFAKTHYPDARIVGKWATQDCMTLDGIPYIGAYSGHTPNLYVATGFQKWGMTSSMVAARLLADQICGKKNPYSAVFLPSRSMLHPQLAVNAWESMVNLLTPTVPRCPHLGCALKYNPFEHSWDCSCHGSRFGENGELLDNPSTAGLTKLGDAT